MSQLTITEALAEIPTIQKRIEKKQEFVFSYLYRQSNVRDPHEKDGGSQLLIERELQSIHDLQKRLVDIRSAIQDANQNNIITIGSETKTISDWLTWRREVAPKEQQFFNTLFARLSQMRQEALRKGVSVSDQDKGYSNDVVVNINEKKLSETIEGIEEILGVLDGQLSLKNATLVVEL